MVSNPEASATYVSPSMFALRNAVCASSCRTFHYFSAVMASTIRMLCSLQTGLKIPPQSAPSTTFHPWATMSTLKVPSTLRLKTLTR